MKHIKAFESFINESKTIGNIYHFTDLTSLEGIMELDKMWAWSNFISFTRNPMLFKETAFARKNVRITFDGEKLSERFHIEPYMYDVIKDPAMSVTEPESYKVRKSLYGHEKEERVKLPELSGVKKYILL